MNIIKIGGAILKNRNGFFRMINILNNHCEKPLIVVVSAFSTATRQLEKAARIAEQGKEKEAQTILKNVIEEHINYAKELLNDEQTLESLEFLFCNSQNKIHDYLKGLAITRELTARTLDTILSFGEFFALHTVNHFLKEQGFDIICFDSTNLIVTNNNFGRAKPLIKETKNQVEAKLSTKIKKDSIILTQGFVAKNKIGEITTMGIESSNLTAALLAEIFDVNEITFWTDVEGFRTADPKFIDSTKPIKQLSYSEALRAASNGLKLIYPDMINIAESKKIKLIYKSAFEPENNFSIITAEDKQEKNPMIILKDNLIKIIFDAPSDESKKNICGLNDELITSNVFSLLYVSPDKISVVIPKNSKLLTKISNRFHSFDSYNCSVLTLLSIDKQDIVEILPRIYEMCNEKHSEVSFDFRKSVSRLIVQPIIAVELWQFLHKELIS